MELYIPEGLLAVLDNSALDSLRLATLLGIDHVLQAFDTSTTSFLHVCVIEQTLYILPVPLSSKSLQFHVLPFDEFLHRPSHKDVP